MTEKLSDDELRGKIDLFLKQGHVLVLDVAIERFRELIREDHGIIGFDEIMNEHGVIHIKRWEKES